MEFTEEQTAVYEAAEKVFTFTPPTVEDVNKGSVPSYLVYAEQSMAAGLYYYGLHKLAGGIDFAELERLKQEERDRKLIERGAEVRDTIVIGFLSGLMAKIGKKFPGAETNFALTGEGAELLVDNGADEILVTYHRAQRKVSTAVEGQTWEEDVTLIKGSVSPRQQLEGFAAVLNYLDADA